MFLITGLIQKCKTKWQVYQEAQAMTEFATLVQSGISDQSAKTMINNHYGRQFDWEKLFPPIDAALTSFAQPPVAHKI